MTYGLFIVSRLSSHNYIVKNWQLTLFGLLLKFELVLEKCFADSWKSNAREHTEIVKRKSWEVQIEIHVFDIFLQQI